MALTPHELFEKLGQWGFDTIVIPHGNTWGFYTPPGTSWDKQLTAANDPDRRTLIEVYSGHGNSEEYRTFQEIAYDANGAPVCPEPTPTYTPCCWQAGEIVRSRCGDAPAAECERRVADARRNYLNAGAAGRATMPWASVEDWKDCGQCRDCFNPAFNYRPRVSAQYALAISNFDDPAAPRRFRFGLSRRATNSARPGTGYGVRPPLHDRGARDEAWRLRLLSAPAGPRAVQHSIRPTRRPDREFPHPDFERQASFFATDTVAVHAEGRIATASGTRPPSRGLRHEWRAYPALSTR